MVVGRCPARAQRSVEIAPIVPPTAVTPRINVHRRPISVAVYEAVCKKLCSFEHLHISYFESY
jgi:hypothetical protein